MQHLKALTKEFHEETARAANTPKGRRLIRLLQANLKKILSPNVEEQRVAVDKQRVTMPLPSELEQQQRVIDNTPIITIPRITNAEPILQARNLTSKRVLKQTSRSHRRVTRNNTPGQVPPINRVEDDAEFVQLRPQRTQKSANDVHSTPQSG
jgi:hypothetical protein